MYAARTNGNARSAADTAGSHIKNTIFRRLRLRIMAPGAPQRAACQEHYSPDSGAVVRGKALKLCHRNIPLIHSICSVLSIIICCHSRSSVTKRAFQPDTRTESDLYASGFSCAARSMAASVISIWRKKPPSAQKPSRSETSAAIPLEPSSAPGKQAQIQRSAGPLQRQICLTVRTDRCCRAAKICAGRRRSI